jgi:enoyl-CoA hydratase/3-hydroxyacyl-CoA dehydrogenase
MLWGDSIGAKYIHGKLQEWAKRYGSSFEPCSYLAERAAKGIPLVRMPILFR